MTATPAEVSWFAALCDDDYEYLGVADPSLRSSYPHCRDIVLRAQQHGFDNVLLPSGYELGLDSVAFAAAVAPELDRMQLLVAVRAGETWPPQLARQLATLDAMLHGRLTINIISSDLPGESRSSPDRYARTREVMHVLRELLAGRSVDHHGDFYDFALDPPRAVRPGACPPLYFGGLSEEARDVAAEHADVYLMWPDTEAAVGDLVADMNARAARFGRALRFGYRVHTIVRDSESEARAAAARLVSRLDDGEGARIRARSLDSQSVGVRRQAELREQAARAGGYIEDNLWTGIGRARSGCGAAILGDPDQVAAKLARYRALGIDAFILSGYPHLDACDRFGLSVLPRLSHAPFARHG
jgi:alkanesulfonate monooxygenase